MSDPVGRQKRISGDNYRQSFQKLVDDPAPKNLDGGFNKKSGTRGADIKTTPSKVKDWQGKSGGNTTHKSYGGHED